MAERRAPPDPLRANRILGLAIALIVLVLDQLGKWVIADVVRLHDRPLGQLDLLPIFRLNWVPNLGVSMGFLTANSALQRWLLVGLTAAISIFVLAWLWREKRRDDTIALGLVLGGALGNILDRVRLGYVVDFLDLHFGEWHPFLVFNLGDAAITIGVLLLLLRALLTRERKAPREKV
ncbi:MAG TPA: signal peptidase II [Allosphingosinicella sp.]|jgi:signal peptidase II|nr:signal peptidase II [Allosphingosinicella sp.]